MVVGHLLLACALAAFAADHGWHPATALAYLAIPGFMPSMLFGLPESLAAAGLTGGLLFWRRDRRLLAAICFGVSGLIRETSLLIPACLAVVELWTLRPRFAASLAAAFMPAIIWRLFVWMRLSPVYGARAFYYSPGDLGLPTQGLFELTRAALLGSQAAPERLAGLTLPLLLLSMLGAATLFLIRRRDGLSLAAVGYGIVAICLNYPKIWSHVPSGERATYEVFVCVLALAMTEPRLAGRWLALAAGVVALYTLLASPEAAATRGALLLIQ